jgi:ATP/ADP translocase/HEAT repeat protein
MSTEVNGAAGVRERVASALSIRPGEATKTALLFAHLLTASSIFILGRTVRDTLFLSRYPLSALPWMFVLYGVASALTVVVYSQVADKLPRDRLIAISCGLGALTYVATYVAVKAGLSWIYPVFYVWSEVAANLFIVQFWTYANDLNDARAARRLFGLVGSARVAGVVLIGLLAGAIVDLIGTEQLLLVLVVLMVILAGLARVLRRHAPAAPVAARTPARGKKEPAALRDPHVRALSVFLLLTFIALTIGDYQFKAIAKATFQEDALARYFSLFYAGTGILSFLFQVFVTPRILRRLGVGWGMSVMPTVFGGASLALLFVPHLAIATVMKFADNGFQYTVHETTLQALYVPFPERVKARTRAFLDAVIKPASYGVGGLVLVVLAPRLDVVSLSFVVVGVVLLWMITIPRVRARYVKALQRTLGLHGGLGVESAAELGSEAREVLAAVLEKGDPRVRALALEHLEGPLPEALVPTVEKLALHGDPHARRVALRALTQSGASAASAAAVRAALKEDDPTLRGAAAEACGPILGDACVEPLEALLDDPVRPVRAHALAGLLGHGGVEGAIVGGKRLAELLRSERASDRVEATDVLGRLGHAAYRPVRELLRDPVAEVRRAALRAAVHVVDPRLVPELADALVDPLTRGRAGAALVAIGAPAAEALLRLLDAEETSRGLRLALPRLLRRIPCPAAFEGLHRHARHADGHVRLRVLAALGSIRAKLGAPPLAEPEVVELTRAELARGYRRLAAFERARPVYGTPLLELAHAFYAERTSKRVLRLMQLRYDKAPLDLVRKGIAQPSRRNNALELLDGVLEPALRGLVMPWFDDAPVAQRIGRAGALVGEVPEPLAYLHEFCHHGNPYYAALSLDAIARHPSPEGLAVAEESLAQPSPLVREMALVAIAACDRGAGERAARAVRDDESKVVSARAALLASPREGQTMHTTLEKVLLLKAASVFAKVETEDLAPMAHAAEEQSFVQGDTILEEGEVGDVLFLVVDGRVAVKRGGVTLATLGPGETFGEMAVLDAEPRSATVVVLEDSTCLAIASEDFYDVLREQVEIAEGVIRMLTHRLREADRASDPVSLMPPAPNE